MKFNCGCQFDRLDWDEITLECPATWDLLSEGLTKGVFQLEKSLGRRWSKKVKPRNIDELADVISLIRPGCLEAKYREDRDGKMLSISDTYVKVRDGEIEAEYIHPSLEPIMRNTYGALLYQEQIMDICKDYAGFTLLEADDTRRAVGKKDDALMIKVKTKFIESAAKLGRDPKMSEHIFGWIDKFSGYGFNKCLSGKTLCRRPSKNQYGDDQAEIGHLYKLVNDKEYAVSCNQIPLRKKLRQFGYGKCLALDWDGRIRPQNIRTIHFNGPKELYRVIDSDGRTIECTIDHKFMGENGQMIPIGDIGIGGRVIGHISAYENEYTYNYNMHKTKVRGKQDHLLDKNGRHNGGFIDGNWTAFESIKAQFDHVENCEICRQYVERFEWHHVDRDRSNNVRENLQKLCVSCHKKEDYKLGRTKRWEKGHKISNSTIISIEYIGIEDTYDIEMDTLEHNWIANDFVVSNSHAVGYAMLSYRTAYAKMHFPIEFFKSKLSESDSKIDEFDEIKQLVYEAKLFNIKVLPPSVRTLNTDFAFTENDELAFGITHIKGVGQSAIENLGVISVCETETDLFNLVFTPKPKPSRKKKDLDNIPPQTEEELDLVIDEKISEAPKKASSTIKKNVIEALIKAGALDHITKDRMELLKKFTFMNELTGREQQYLLGFGKIEEGIADDLFTTIRDSKIPNKKRLPVIEEKYTVVCKDLGGNKRRMALGFEKFHLGMALTGSETELYYNQEINSTCRDFLKLRNETKVSLGVLIEEVRRIQDKNGNWMAFAKVSDSTYMLDGVVIFASTLPKCGWLVEPGKIVLMKGKKRDTSLLVDSIEHL